MSNQNERKHCGQEIVLIYNHLHMEVKTCHVNTVYLIDFVACSTMYFIPVLAEYQTLPGYLFIAPEKVFNLKVISW